MRNLTRTISLIGVVMAVGESQAVASAFMKAENSPGIPSPPLMCRYRFARRRCGHGLQQSSGLQLSYLAGTEPEVGAAVVFPGHAFRRGAPPRSGPPPSPESTDRDIGQVALIPHVYGAFDLNDRIKLGLALTTPFGSTVDYGHAWPGRYVNVKTAALALDVNPNISYKLADWISVGGGFSYQYLRLELASA